MILVCKPDERNGGFKRRKVLEVFLSDFRFCSAMVQVFNIVNNWVLINLSDLLTLSALEIVSNFWKANPFSCHMSTIYLQLQIPVFPKLDILEFSHCASTNILF